MKRILALILALTLCLSAVPGEALADPIAEEVSETTGLDLAGEAGEVLEEEQEVTRVPDEEKALSPAVDPEEAPADEADDETAGETAYALAITEEPEDTLILEGTAFFYVSADVYLGEDLTEEIPMYQWQTLEEDGWAELPGQTDQVLVLENLTEASVGSVYRCRISLGELEVYSQTAAITGLDPGEESDGWGTVTFINPLYKDVLTEEDLPQISPVETYAEEEEFTRYASQEEASEAMKQALLRREASFSAEFQLNGSSVPVPASFMRPIYYGAVAHTGMPTEGDYLRYEFGGYRGTYSWDDRTYIFRCTYNFLYYTTADQEQELNGEVQRILSQLDLGEKTPKEKTDAIYDYLCTHVVYDNKNLNNTAYTLKYTAYAALMKGTAVCQGYATAFYRLCLESGVDTREVTSEEMNHAWNIVKLGRFYYCVDATWDANHQGNYLYYLKGRDYWLKNHKAQNVSVMGDAFDDPAFAERYPVPAEDYETVPTLYELTEDGTLVLGDAYSPRIGNFAASELDGNMVTNAPWREAAEQIRRIRFPQGVTYIGSNAFRGLTNLEVLELPETVTQIEDGAFWGCTGLKTLTLPQERMTIGTNAFRGLTGLETLEIPETVRTIEDSAFRDCEGLKTLTIRSGPGLGRDVFSGCPIETLTVPAEWNAARLNGALSRLKTLYLTDGGYMASYTASAPAPWSGTGVQTVVFDGELQKIGNYGLKDCREIRMLVLPRELHQIGTGAFAGCTGLEELTLPAKLTKIYARAFWGCDALRTLTFTGETLPAVDQNGFYGAELTCLYPCAWRTVPKGSFGGRVTWKRSHSPEYIPGRQVTQTADGSLEHWKCSLCGRLYREESCTAELTAADLVIYRETYTVTYADMEEGNNPNPAVYPRTRGLTLQNADRTGYRFGGWYRDEARSQRITAIPANSHEDITLYPKWTAIRYVLAFHGNGGSGYIAARTMEYGQDTVLPAAGFTRVGYVLSGWNTKTDGSGEAFGLGDTARNFVSANMASCTLYAQWEPITYTLVLDPNNGTAEPVSRSLRYGEEFCLPKETAGMAGYHISAWSARPDGRGIAYAGGRTVKNLSYTDGAQVTLYGRWTANSYTVVYHGSGAVSWERRQRFLYDRAANLAGNSFARTGYTFAGWSEEPEGTAKYTNMERVENLTAEVDGIVDLYAVWKPITYSVAFRANGASGEMASAQYVYDRPDTLPEMTFTRPGFTFLGWSAYPYGKVMYAPGQEIKNLTYIQGRTVTLYALWEAHSYEIRFHGGEGADGITRDMTKLYCGRSYVLSSCGFRRTGYDFAGWKDGTGKEYPDRYVGMNFSLEEGGTLELYAQWKPHAYTIAYRNCLSCDGNENPASYDVETPVALRAPVRPGAQFLGWYLDPYFRTRIEEIAPGSRAGNLTLYARWAGTGRGYRYTIVYDGNGATYGRMNSMSCYNGGLYYLGSSYFLRTGYTFQGWSLSKDARTPDWTARSVVGNLAGGEDQVITLYAVWKPNTYRVYYQSIIGADKNPNPDTFTVEDRVKLREPQRPGCTFLGWYQDPYYRTRVEEITPGERASNLVLYARWDGGGRGYRYSVVFDGNGATYGRMNPMNGCYNGIQYTLGSVGFLRTGYTFQGWSLSKDARIPDWTNRAAIGNLADRDGQTVTLYAVWKK